MNDNIHTPPDIDKHIPLPVKKDPTKPWQMDLAERLEKGDSVKVPNEKDATALEFYINQAHGKDAAVTRKIKDEEETYYRVWRKK